MPSGFSQDYLATDKESYLKMKKDLLTLVFMSMALAACAGGQNGIDGKDGKDGGSCHVADNGDGAATITCPDGSSFTVRNGEDGKKGDAGSDGELGENGKDCYLTENLDGSAAVVCPADGSSFIVRGNIDNYANYCAPGFYGKNCENECRSCGEHGDCNDGVTGDGSCICEKGYYGENCVDCTKGVEGSYFGKEECTYTDTRDANSEVIYPVVRIGDQIWMAKNMAYQNLAYQAGIFCLANTDEDKDFIKNYGCLYKAYHKDEICPQGWHIPTADEFFVLIGGTEYSELYDSKTIQSPSWNSDASDSSGFGALAAGYAINYKKFSKFGSDAFFWSSTKVDISYNYFLRINSNGNGAMYKSLDSDYRSVRCLKD